MTTTGLRRRLNRCLLILLLTQFCFAQQLIKFRHLTLEDGLSQSTVETIVQDNLGLLWFGTEDGLNRYDGYQITVYRHNPVDPYSISNNNIWCLYVDKKGALWIGTYSGGLNRFDPVSERFDRYLHDPDDSLSISSNAIRSIAEDADGNLWIGTRGGGLNLRKSGDTDFMRIYGDRRQNTELSSNNVRYVLPVEDYLWIATDNGFCRYDPQSQIFHRYFHDPQQASTLADNNVRHLFRDRAGQFWIATANGLSRFNEARQVFTNYRHSSGDPASVSSSNIRKTFQDSRGKIWIATTHGGVNYFDQRENRFYAYRHNQSDARSLSNDNVRVMFEDRGGLLWLGTIGGGVNMFDPRAHYFTHHRYDPESNNGLRHPIVWAIAEGPDSDLWIGSNAGGLDRYQPDTGKYLNYQHNRGNPRSLSDNHIRTLQWDQSGQLWVGTRYSGIDIFDPPSGQFKNLRHNPDVVNSLTSNNVRDIHQDHDGNFWFATWGGGLNYYHPASRTFTHFRHNPLLDNSLSSDNLVSIYQDQDSVFWIATDNGLNRLLITNKAGYTAAGKPPKAEITRFYHVPEDTMSLSNSYVLSIHQTQDGDLWFGTMQGISHLQAGNRKQPQFLRYFSQEGLPNDVIYAILEDEKERLWFSTNHGISRFDRRHETFKNFDARDGLHITEFNTGAADGTRDGRFVFGGINGADSFYPDSLEDDPYLPPLVFTGLNIYDRPAKLTKNINFLDKITLSHNDNYFSFEFASLDFSTPDRIRYAYRLEGFDQDWLQVGKRRFAGYTHLDAGDYRLRVKATNGDGVWNDRGRTIRIIITPPFWKTWWFMLAAGGLLIAGIALVVTYRVRQLLAIERLRTRIAADLHDDIGAGLSEISILGEVIRQRLGTATTPEIVSSLEKIGQRSRQLIDSMSDIVWLVSPHRDSLHDLISRLGSVFETHLDAANIAFRSTNIAALKGVRLSMEIRQQLYLIFKEALHNAIKYSNGRRIELTAQLEGRYLHMVLRDDGQGFDTAAGSSGNGLDNMKKRARLIGGSLTTESGSGSGTTVTFRGTLPALRFKKQGK